MSSRLPCWVSQYISIPYDECDCFQLLQKIYAEQYGITVDGITEQRGKIKSGDWVDVIKEGYGVREGDVILFKNTAVNRHVAIVLDHELMIHNQANSNCCIESWKAPLWRNRLVGIYRWHTECPK